MNIRKITAFITALTITALTLSGCAQQKDNSQNEQKTESKTEQSSEAQAFTFEPADHQIEVAGKKYQVFDKQVRFNYADVPYEEWLSYESPYDEYIPTLLEIDDGINDPDIYGLEMTAAFAIRYAYENGIEELEFPVDIGDLALTDGWTLAGLSFPSIPVTAGNCDYELTEEGYYRVHIADSVLKAASHSEETIAAAKKVVDSMPADCVTDAQKAYYLYDWVCQNVVYDVYHSESTGLVNNEPQSAYGALVKKRAVCDGIACAVQLLFNMADIDCGKVQAFSSVGEDVGHVWNYAYIDGEVWDFDATWDINRFYESEGDEITDDGFDGLYEWFGTSRSAKSDSMDINDICLYTTPVTSSSFTENSPVQVIYDYVTTADMETGELTTYHHGEKLDDFSIEDIKTDLEEQGKVTLKYDHPLVMLGDLTWLESSDPLFEGTENDELIQNVDVDSYFMIFAK